jgi:hypothetical protein
MEQPIVDRIAACFERMDLETMRRHQRLLLSLGQLVADIDQPWARALANATLSEVVPERCREIAGEIAIIAARHKPPVAAINVEWGKALYNATVRKPSSPACREIAAQIALIANRHTPPVPPSTRNGRRRCTAPGQAKIHRRAVARSPARSRSSRSGMLPRPR